MLNRDDSFAVVTALAVALATVLLAVVVAATASAPGTARPAALDPGPACVEWTDGCVVCQRVGGGGAACSTPGIACTRGALRCLRGT